MVRKEVFKKFWENHKENLKELSRKFQILKIVKRNLRNCYGKLKKILKKSSESLEK